MHWRSRLAAGAILTILVSRSYQEIGWSLDARRASEAGRLVDAGGVRLQLYCTGEGSPAVILESGLGEILEQWRRVQPEVARFTRVCSYDRAGHGNSSGGRFPRTSDRIAEELHALLQRAGERPPYILVGHSAGGYHVRVFHGRYASEVAAMVLVDATQEDQYRLLPPAWKALGAAMVERYRSQARWAPVEVELGIKRLMSWMRGSPAPYLLLQCKYFAARASELETIEVSAEQARAAGSLGAKPLIVLTGSKGADAMLSAGLSRRDVEEFQRIWVNDLQSRLAALSTRGKWIVLPDSGHDVPADRPDAIVEAIREVSGMAESLE
jgi:pimeloyl-ACP methyl ester carboxylesterase